MVDASWRPDSRAARTFDGAQLCRRSIGGMLYARIPEWSILSWCRTEYPMSAG